MPNFNRKRAKQILFRMITNIDKYEISTFKEHIGDMLREVDHRDDEDKTDFSFLQRRKTDRQEP